jgi:hypothetical protein
MFFLLGKIYPFLKEFREKVNNPEAFVSMEKVATGSKTGRKRLERMVMMAEQRRKAQAKPAKKG